MQIIIKKFLTLSITTIIFLLNGCSSHHQENIISTIPIVGEDMVIIEDKHSYVEEEHLIVEDPSWTTKLVLDSEAFTAEEYVQKEPVITYKYDFDTKFYKEARWRSANE
jgi:uncharacterized protein YcfL